MITVTGLHYAYPSGPLALRDIHLAIPEGALVLMTGVSGSGKSTLLRALNGLVPHFYGGQFSGVVQVDGQNTLSIAPRQLARTVGFIFQDPETQFVAQIVEDEIAFGLENQGVPPAEMRARIAEALDMLGITPLRQRHIATLSGGEAQRVAIASVLALRPRYLILDEPTSQLDPPAANALLDTLVGLNRDQGMTIILAEHRLERVLPYATHLLHLAAEGLQFGPVREILPLMPLRPPVVEVALRYGWTPLPLSVAEARPFVTNGESPQAYASEDGAPQFHRVKPTHDPDPVIEIRDLTAGYNGKPVLSGFDWSIQGGEIVGLLGVNGAGKSTLLRTLVGLLRPMRGTVRVLDIQPAQAAKNVARRIGYVPQNPNSVLFAETLDDELRFTLRNHKLADDDARINRLLARLDLERYAGHYPRDLSGGERQRAALGAMLAAEPPVVLLDEPTRGLDYVQKRRLRDILRGWAAEGKTCIIATHDVEWIDSLATRITALHNGRIIANGAPGEVLPHLPGFKTQLAELFQELPAAISVPR